MLYGFIKFNTLPSIGFAHHFYSDNHSYTYNNKRKSFEIVYVNSGGVEAEFNGQKIYAPEGSIFVLFRHLPIKVRGTGGENQSHSTVQAEIEYDFSLFSDGDALPEDGAVLPFVTFPCKETDVIKKEIYSIISQMGESRDKNSFSASLSFVNIIQILNKAARKRITTPRTVLSYKIKNYISDHIDSSAITLAELAIHLNKTPNYINFVFKKENGTTINQYISCEKMKKVAQLMKRCGTEFKDACKMVGICNYPYGYRLFKKHMGTTPKEFMKGDTHK